MSDFHLEVKGVLSLQITLFLTGSGMVKSSASQTFELGKHSMTAKFFLVRVSHPLPFTVCFKGKQQTFMFLGVVDHQWLFCYLYKWIFLNSLFRVVFEHEVLDPSLRAVGEAAFASVLAR